MYVLPHDAPEIFTWLLLGHSDPEELKRQASSGTSQEAIERRQQVQEVRVSPASRPRLPGFVKGCLVVPFNAHSLDQTCSKMHVIVVIVLSSSPLNTFS